jgi:nucleoside-diphosphate-sugar epimerase
LHLLLCGHGYLGQAISRDFLAAGWDVTALSRSGDDGSLACDLSSAAEVAALEVRPDFIVHCASSGRGGAEAYRAVYFNGCRHLLDRFPGVPLIFTSSTSVYAQTDGSEVTEESPAEPDRETGKILREAEDLVLSNGGVITRLSGIYGPGRSVILKKFLSGEAMIEEDGRRFLNQIHRDDAASAILRLASQASTLHSRLFNLSDSHPLSQLECYEGLGSMFGRPLPPAGPRDSDRKRGWTHKRVSNARLRATGWEPRFPSFLDAAASIAPTLESG